MVGLDGGVGVLLQAQLELPLFLDKLRQQQRLQFGRHWMVRARLLVQTPDT